jgi:hypothetical protein
VKGIDLQTDEPSDEDNAGAREEPEKPPGFVFTIICVK